MFFFSFCRATQIIPERKVGNVFNDSNQLKEEGIQPFAMREDWLTQIENREGLIILFVNYTFFSVVSLVCLLFVLCLTHTTSPPNDIMYSISFIAYSFVVVTIILADYVVYTINSHREIRIK